MANRAYSSAFRAEVVAASTVEGAEAASERYGVDVRSVRRWAGAAGKAPADAVTSSQWSDLGALARARVAADLVAGKVRTKDAAIIAAIASRNEAKPDAERVAEPSSVDAKEAFIDWLVEAE